MEWVVTLTHPCPVIHHITTEIKEPRGWHGGLHDSWCGYVIFDYIDDIPGLSDLLHAPTRYLEWMVKHLRSPWSA